MDKKAVDQASKDYWNSYFKEYGKMWVRDIPKRIKTAMVDSGELNIKTASGNIVPLAADVSKNGVFSIEAAFSGKLDDQEAKVLITAEFNQDGELKEIELTRIQ